MKVNYENRQRFYLTRRIPVIIRIDGRAFHSLTRDMEKPFDDTFIRAMKTATQATADDMQGFKLAFVQSDEASFLLTDYDSLQTEAWLDYNLNKITSLSASLMSVHFGLELGSTAVFDSRAFNVPREEVANYFLWRAKDWHRNSIWMYAQSFFSHAEMQNKSIEDLHEMLHGAERNWATDLAEHLRNGWWHVNNVWRSDILPVFKDVDAIVQPFMEGLRTDAP